MGCDTKLVILTESKDVADILERVGNAITTIHGVNPKQKFGLGGNPNYRVNFKYNPYIGYATADFFHGEDARMIFVNFTCDSDYSELGHKKIILSLGMWGGSMEIMRIIAERLSGLGDIFLKENDCDEKDWEKL